MLKADLHLHTCFSCDSHTAPLDIVERCLEEGINCLAVTDHGQIEGALAVAELAPFKVIVGEEVLTPQGEIIGLFLSKKIPSPCSPWEAVKEIKRQGGLVIIPHPFDSLRSTALKESALNELVREAVVDAIEVLNGRVILAKHNKAAAKFAQQNSLPATAGSDSHRLDEIGKVYLQMPDYQTPQEFLQSLSQAQIIDRRGRYFGIRAGALWERATNRKEARKSREYAKCIE